VVSENLDWIVSCLVTLDHLHEFGESLRLVEELSCISTYLFHGLLYRFLSLFMLYRFIPNVRHQIFIVVFEYFFNLYWLSDQVCHWVEVSDLVHFLQKNMLLVQT
jgi:hypothetical protein